MKGIEFLLLSFGAIAGAFLRYKIASLSPIMVGSLPVNILIVNVIGSYIIGAFSVFALAWNLDAKYSLLVAVGFCGSLTTMSSFALETTGMIDNRQFSIMALNILANVGMSLGAVLGGRTTADLMMTKGIGGGA